MLHSLMEILQTDTIINIVDYTPSEVRIFISNIIIKKIIIKNFIQLINRKMCICVYIYFLVFSTLKKELTFYILHFIILILLFYIHTCYTTSF